MIVDPDFFNHWKTLTLIGELDDDQLAPVYVLRLWAHCQNRRDCRFKLSAKALKALCHYSGHPDKLLAGLVASGFVEPLDDGELYVRGWDEYNSQLIANWENGKKGGRPKKGSKPREKPKRNPSETHGLAMDNPTETHAKPIREDEMGVDKKTHTLSSARRCLEQISLDACLQPIVEELVQHIELVERVHFRPPDPASLEVVFSQLATAAKGFAEKHGQEPWEHAKAIVGNSIGQQWKTFHYDERHLQLMGITRKPPKKQLAGSLYD